MIIKKFEELVEQFKEKPVLKAGKKSVTYGELDLLSNKIGHTAIMEDKKQDTGKCSNQVALFFEHGIDLIIAALGVLKAMKAYVPLDISYPSKRILYILENSESSLILTNHRNFKNALELSEQLPHKPTVINIETLDISTPDTGLVRDASADRTAYILYTSGSTGKPKGVSQLHRNVLYYTRNWINRFSITPEDRMSLFTSFTHDGAVQDLFSALLSGACLYPFSIKESGDYDEFYRVISEERITIWHSVPSLFRFFSDTLTGKELLSDVRWVLLGGEPIREHDMELYKKYFPNAGMANVYGQTESSVGAICTMDRNSSFDRLNLGKPLDETEILLVDEYGEIIEGVGTGEIVIASDYIAPGYWKNPELGKNIFVHDEELGHLYFTGDMGQLIGAGIIKMMGRKDFQVKIRGFRVETGEIETELLQHPNVKETVVIARKDERDDLYLSAYIVQREDFPVESLRDFLAARVPDYMVPRYFMALEKMPLTENGKIDRKALPDIAAGFDRSDEYEGPSNEIEERMQAIWHELMKTEGISVNANFFEIGGHSLSAITLTSRIHKTFDCEIQLIDIFNNPTIKKLSQHVMNSEKSRFYSIEPAEEREYYDLSSAQRRFYILQQMDPRNTGFNISEVFITDGVLDVERFGKAFEALIKRHEVFRTSFKIVEGKPVQVIHRNVRFAVEMLDNKQGESRPEVVRLKEFIRPFDLSVAPLLRVGMLKREDGNYIIAVDIHHIASDGLSQLVLAGEFGSLYGGVDMAPLKIQYKDFSHWQNSDYTRAKLKKMEDFWLDTFKDGVPVLDLPTDYKRDKVQHFEGNYITFEINSHQLNTLSKIAFEQGATLYMALLAICNIWLAKICSQDSVIIGTGTGGRKNPDLQNMVGSLQNMIVLANSFSGNQLFSEFLDNVKKRALDAFENQDYPFDELVTRVAVHRETGRNPLFDFFYILNDFDLAFSGSGTPKGGDIPTVRFKPYKESSGYRKERVRFDLALYGAKHGDALSLKLEYSTSLFKPEKVNFWVECYKKVLSTVLENKEIHIREIDILPEDVRNEILYTFNDTKAEYSRDKTMHGLFEEQVLRTPANTAVILDNESLTYQELNVRANRVAWELKKRGLIPNRFAAVIMDRSIEMVVAVMAILKSGGAYVPIEPYLPQARIITCLSSLNVEWILTCSSRLETMESIRSEMEGINHVLTLDEKSGDIESNSDENPEPAAISDDIAYVIFTSGTTGTPKGVVVKHKPVINVVEWVNNTFHVNENDKQLFVVSLSFDLSVYDIFGILAAGGAVRIAGIDDVKSPERLLEIIFDEGITFWDSAPAALQLLVPFLDRFSSEENRAQKSKLRLVFLSGDWIPVTMPDILKKTFRGVSVISLGGATEATIWSNYYPIGDVDPSWLSIPYGKPIQNAAYYILDSYLNPCPIGVAGDLFIGGECLASGYNDEVLTAAKFIDNPFVPGEKMYRTGDMAKWFPDGNMEFLGRMDNQVKIRGYRIELGEIESQLLKHNDIKEAVVIAKGQVREDRYLCAYYVTDREVTPSQLNEYLSGLLPAYMIPPYFVKLESMPLTSNGKVDRKRLPEPTIETVDTYAPPRDFMEETLVDIWSTVLKLDKKHIGIDADFFDLGGHSLKATNVVSLIHEKLDVKVPLAEIFRFPSIRELAGYLRTQAKDKFEAIEPVEEREYYNASSGQKRLFLIQKREPQSTVYNIQRLWDITGFVDKERIDEVFKKLIVRHKSLRTTFMMINEQIVQRVHDDVEFEAEYPQTFDKAILREFVRPFDLTRAPMMRVGIIRGVSNRDFLIIDMHHIVMDGVSLAVIIEDFLALYQGQDLPPLKIQYYDYTGWQESFDRSERKQRQLEYWERVLGGELPVLNIPTDNPRPSLLGFKGDVVIFSIGPELMAKSKELEARSGATLFMILLSVYHILLMKYSGQEDIRAGFPVAGRPHADLLRVVGMFVNLIVLRSFPCNDKSYSEYLDEVKSGCMEAFENQDIQFDELVERLKITPDPSRNPLFDASFMLQNYADKGGKVGENETNEGSSNTMAHFDLELNIYEMMDGMRFFLVYSSALFKRSTAETMAKRYVEILEKVVCNADIRLKDIVLAQTLEKTKSTIQLDDEVDFGM